ncbi:MAG TPA: dienelactone hydrolase family protein [Dehalococcoidia bacterium]
MAGEMITFPNDSTDVSGYLCKPAGGGRSPCVIVIQEWWGLVPHIKDLADRFAGEGFLALAPDLYHGPTATEPDGAMQLARSLAWDSALHDLRASAKYLKARPESNGKLGVVGFCMGGGLSFRFAAHSDAPDAAVIFYGSSPSQLDEAKSVACPVLGLYGETDTRITSQAPALAEAMQAAGKPFEYRVYQGAPHGFFNNESAQFDRAASEDAWPRTLAFFRQHLS